MNCTVEVVYKGVRYHVFGLFPDFILGFLFLALMTRCRSVKNNFVFNIQWLLLTLTNMSYNHIEFLGRKALSLPVIQLDTNVTLV